MSRVIHFEIPSADPDKSMAFYRQVFGWEFNQWGDEPYWLTKTGDDNKPGINGAIASQKYPEQPIINTVEVLNIDKTIQAIEEQGGEIVVPKMAVPTVGYVIYFKDPEGFVSGALQPDASAV